jgi:hypothetical protein
MGLSGFEYKFEIAEKFESIFKTALTNESEDLEVKFNEKIEGQKAHDTVPLIYKNYPLSKLLF